MQKIITASRKSTPMRFIEIQESDGTKKYQNIDTGKEYDQTFFKNNFEQYGYNYLEIASVLIEQYLSTVKIINSKDLFITIEKTITNIFKRMNNRYKDKDIEFSNVYVQHEKEGDIYIATVIGILCGNEFKLDIKKRVG